MNNDFSKIQVKLAPVEQWVSDLALDNIYSSNYWNDIEKEKGKEWWIADGNYTRCMDYLQSSGLMKEWAVVEKYMSELPPGSKLKVVDLAAGVGWTSALISRMSGIEEIHSIEISKHRITDLFPYAVHMFNGDPEKIKRYIGSFYDLVFKDESMDIIFMSQAFHHAERPLKLLGEIDRVLPKGGKVIMMGENYIGVTLYIRRMVKMLLKQYKFCTNFYELFPPDDVEGGDHYYRVSDYYMFFQLLGYKLQHQIVDKQSLVLIAQKL